MKKSFKLLAAALAAVTAMTCSSVGASAYKIRTIDGIKYRYSNSGELKGKYSGWLKSKNGTSYYFHNGVILRDSWLSENGKRTYYLDSSGRPTVGEALIGSTVYYFDTDGKLVYGVYARGSGFTRTGCKLGIGGAALGNDAASVWTGEEYFLERKDASGAWAAVPVKAEAYGWDDIAYEFFVDGRIVQRNEAVDWQWLYGKLDGGEYRLCRPYYVKLTPNGKTEKKMFYIPFKVVSDAEGAWGISMTVSNVTTDGLTITVSQPSSYTGYVEFDGSYILEIQDKDGNWTDVDSKARRKATFSDYYTIFRDQLGSYPPDIRQASDSIEFYSGELEEGHYRIRRMFSGDSGGIKGTLYATAEFDILEDTPNSWGISMYAGSDACESGMTLYVDSVSNGYYGSEIWTDEEFDIEELGEGGEWETLEFVSDDGYDWDHTPIAIKNNSKNSFGIDWEEVYDKLSAGTYRISKTFYTNRGTQTLEKTFYSVFVIDKGGINIGKYDITASVTKVRKRYIELDLVRTGKYAGKVSWNGGFELHKKNSAGKWTLVKGISALGAVSDEACSIPNNYVTHLIIPYSGYYPTLGKGTYRIMIKTVDKTEHIRYFYARFTIS